MFRFLNLVLKRECQYNVQMSQVSKYLFFSYLSNWCSKTFGNMLSSIPGSLKAHVIKIHDVSPAM